MTDLRELDRASGNKKADPLVMDWSDLDWRQIQRDAKTEASVQETPAYGEYIVWAITAPRSGITDELSEVHRVGTPQKNDLYTTCGAPIPAPVMWFPLTPAIARTMEKHCRFCEAEYARHLREDAA